MARTPSNMVKLGTEVPSFKLINTIDNKFVMDNKSKKFNGVRNYDDCCIL